MSAATTPAAQPSGKALSVCAWHYGNAGSGCGKCPIQAECHGYKGMRQPLTEANLSEWVARFNAAADGVAL